MILYTIRETNAVSCLQFLPENPNPKIKVYNRNQLLENKDSLFPIEKFIFKQFEDQEVQEITLPVDHEQNYEVEKIKVQKINGLHFSHYYYSHTKDTNDESLAKMLKITIDDLLNLEEKLKK